MRAHDADATLYTACYSINVPHKVTLTTYSPPTKRRVHSLPILVVRRSSQVKKNLLAQMKYTGSLALELAP
jgi:hypothetical protein